jgi:SAM-dependent methyltransferase
MSRAKKPKRVFGEDVLSVPREEKRFSTPEIVAMYRAEKLACRTIVDLCSGYGFQAFAFSQTCNHVIAVELDPKKVAQAEEYARILGIKNITFICGDVLDQKVVLKIAQTDVDVVFCDPERLPAEKERTLATIGPDVKKLLELYNPMTEQIVIEFPPHIRGLDLDAAFDAEFEYLAVDGVVNRLTLYFGALKVSGKSVVLLPHVERIEVLKKKGEEHIVSSRLSSAGYQYILEPSPAVLLADLSFEALCYDADAKKISAAIDGKEIMQTILGKKVFFFSKEKIVNPFFTTYHILQRTKDTPGNVEQQKKLAGLLRAEGAEKVVLRYHVDPSQYWNERKKLEVGLNGHKTIHLFLFDMAVLSEKCSLVNEKSD